MLCARAASSHPCLQDGSRLEITGLERYDDIKRHILSCIYD
jgi:hypothetical protein